MSNPMQSSAIAAQDNNSWRVLTQHTRRARFSKRPAPTDAPAAAALLRTRCWGTQGTKALWWRTNRSCCDPQAADTGRLDRRVERRTAATTLLTDGRTLRWTDHV